MKQISEYADNMIDNIMLTAWERGAYADQVTGYDEAEALYYQEQESNELKAYIAELEAEVEALRLHKNQEAQISEMRRVGNLMADHLNALGISRHDREWADASSLLPEMIHENKDEKLPNSERNAEITAINSEQDYKSALAEVSRLMNAEPGSEDEARLVRLATLVEAYEDARYPIPDESDPLKGVPFVSFSNAEIAAMTPDHPFYKLVRSVGND